MTPLSQTTRALVFLLLMFVPLVAQARPPQPAATSKARLLTLEARGAFNEGRFSEAAALLEQAYALEPSPSLLYNMARAHQQAGAKERAIDAWERYLASKPGAPDEGAIRTSIQRLRDELRARQELAEQALAEKARADREAEERQRAELARTAVEAEIQRKPRVMPWVLLGAGLAGLGAGVTFGLLSRGAHTEAVNELDALTSAQRQASARTFATVANVSYVVGGALAVAGAAWGTFELLSARPVSTVRLTVGPGSVTLVASF